MFKICRLSLLKKISRIYKNIILIKRPVFKKIIMKKYLIIIICFRLSLFLKLSLHRFWFLIYFILISKHYGYKFL